MKNISISDLIHLLTVILCTNGCQPARPNFTAVSVLCDVSEKAFVDSAYYQKNLPALIQFVIPDTLNPGSDGGRIQLSALNELSQNTAYIASLPADIGGALGPNPYLRKDAASSFQKKMYNAFVALDKAYPDNSNQSKIYQGICRALTILDADTADRKILVVYSDFLENSSLFSFYPFRKADFLENPIQFADSVLNDDCPLPSLTGVEVYLVAYRNEKNDEAVNQALSFWKTVLEHQNATVKIGVDLASMR